MQSVHPVCRHRREEPLTNIVRRVKLLYHGVWRHSTIYTVFISHAWRSTWTTCLRILYRTTCTRDLLPSPTSTQGNSYKKGFIFSAIKDPGQVRLIINHVDSISEEYRQLYGAEIRTLQKTINKQGGKNLDLITSIVE